MKELAGTAGSQSKKQGRGYRPSTKRRNTVHLATLKDLCHLKNSELEKIFSKYQGRADLRGDEVKGGFFARSVF